MPALAHLPPAERASYERAGVAALSRVWAAEDAADAERSVSAVEARVEDLLGHPAGSHHAEHADRLRKVAASLLARSARIDGRAL